MSRVYMNQVDDWGCGYYRCALPVFQCYGDLSKIGVSVHLYRDLHHEETNYDSYIIHRIPAEHYIFLMQKSQQEDKKFILELDDDIFNIPDWMPSDEYKMPKWSLKRSLEMADEIWVATEPLAEYLGFPDKTFVLPNLVDFNIFPKNEEPSETPIRILWMGSMWHDKDIEQVVPAVNKLIQEYGERVQFVFWGCLPTAFADFIRIPGQNIAQLRQKKEYGAKLVYLEGVPFRIYYDRLMAMRPTIGLAPLFDCKFNDSKSNLKFLEYTIAGAATVATDLAPYECISHGEDGLLVEPEDLDGWYENIKKLIDDRELRNNMAKKAREKVYRQFSWQSQGKKQLWLDAFKRLK